MSRTPSPRETSPLASIRKLADRLWRSLRLRSRPTHMLYPERRQGPRFLTLKNAAIAGLALIAALTLLSIWSELRPSRSHASGSLFESPVQSSESPVPPREPMTAIPEGSVYVQPPTGSILVDARTTRAADVPAPASSTSPVPPVRKQTFEPRESQLGKGKRITISGGAEGVQVRTETAPPPAPVPASDTAPPPPPSPPPPSE